MPSNLKTALSQARNRLGLLTPQIEDAVTKATLETKETGKPTTVTIKLVFTPERKGAMGIGGKVTVSLPTPEDKRESGLVFVDAEGRMHLNPLQGEAFEDGLPDELESRRQGR